MPSNSFAAMLQQLGSVDQLIAIHGKIQAGPGRRHQLDALHQAGVAMTVAAWQAFIEKIVPEALDAIFLDLDDPAAVPPAPNWAKNTFLMRRAAIDIQLKKFNTPNCDNVRDLFAAAFGLRLVRYDDRLLINVCEVHRTVLPRPSKCILPS